MTRLQETLDRYLTLQSLFQFPTVETLARQVEVLRYVQGAKTNFDNLDSTEYEEFEL